MDALGGGLIDAANKVAVDILGHERDHRGSQLDNGDKSGVEGHVGVYLILLHALRPEALPAAADIPVAHVVNEALERPCRLGDSVAAEVAVDRADKGVEP